MSLASHDIPGPVKYVFAALSGVGATLVVFPLDVVRMRMQVSNEGSKKRNSNTLLFAAKVVRKEGFRVLYNGISASILRQILYTGTRMSAFQIIYDAYTKDGSTATMFDKIVIGTISGIMGSVVGLPADVPTTRMAVDGIQPPHLRRNYKHVFDAIKRIYMEEGPKALFTAINATIARGVTVNVVQFLSYTEFKEFVIKQNIMSDSLICHTFSSIVAAVSTGVAMIPLDIAKTRLQKMKIIDGKPEYRSTFDIWYKIVTKEGPFGLWKGLTPLILKNIPFSFILFVLYEDVFIRGYIKYIG